MMDIATIREKYPQYQDLSDEQLADGLHAKYYSDMPKEEFYQKINFPGAPSGTSAVLSESGKNILKTLAGAAQHFGKTIIDPMTQTLSMTEFGGIPMPKTPTVVDPESLEGKIGAGIAAVPEFALGGEGIGGMMREAPLIGGLLERAPGIARRAIESAATGGLLAPEGERKGGALLGLLTSPLADIATAAFRPSRLMSLAGRALRAKRTPEEISRLQAITQTIPGREKGITMPAADILMSTPVRKAQVATEGIPFSGISKPYEELNQAARDYQNKFMASLEGQGSTDLDKDVYNQVKNKYIQTGNKFNEQRNEFLSEADLAAPPEEFQFPNTKSVIEEEQQKLDRIKKRRKGKLTSEDDIAAQKIINSYDPKNLDFDDFRDFEEHKKDINREWRAESRKGNYGAANALRKLKYAIHKDLTENVGGNPELDALLRESDQTYANEFKPFEEYNNRKTPFIKAYNSDDENTAGFIKQYLKTGKKQDAYQDLERLLNMSDDPDRVKQLLLSYHLKGTEGNPAKMLAALENLGSKQQALLLGARKGDFDRWQALKKAFPETFGVDYIPKTGVRTAKALMLPAEAGAVALAAAHHPGALTALLGLMGAGRASSAIQRSGFLPYLARKSGEEMPEIGTGDLLRSLILGPATVEGENRK